MEVALPDKWFSGKFHLSGKRVYQALEGWKHAMEASRGYNRANLCLSFQARILAPMKLPARWAPVGWAKFIAPATPVWSAALLSKFFPHSFPPTCFVSNVLSARLRPSPA